MKNLLIVLLLCAHVTSAQKISKADKKMMARLKTHINFLADDKLEGRRTGSAGERLAYEYISNAFKDAGLSPVNGSFIQEFEVMEGKEVKPDSYFFINDKALILNEDYFPLAFSGNAILQSNASVSLRENGSVWFWDLNEILQQNKNNP